MTEVTSVASGGSAEPHFFATPADWRAWLERNHDSQSEVLVGFWKKGTGRPSITWPESVDEALCFGWIDGVRRSLGPDSYTIRFTPRTPTSIWSAVNIARVRELTEQGRMTPAGLRAFEQRADERSAIYSYEQRHEAAFDEAQEAQFRADPAAWDWFQAQAPSYRKAVTQWVTSAKREQTRASRLATLIEDSRRHLRIGPMRRPGS
jgi:uncharacterized protein YdeI (YjbR/CyaY-like superfamily)